jgi:pimeloyl-ACP methyl ester carboxylesterase
MKTIEGGGHFLPLDRPQELLDLLGGFVDAAAKDVLVRWSAAGATQGPIQ